MRVASSPFCTALLPWLVVVASGCTSANSGLTGGGGGTGGSVSTTSGSSQGSSPNTTGATPEGSQTSAAQTSASDASSGTGSGASSCDAPGLTFCEDFESVSLGPATGGEHWTANPSNGVLTIDSTHARGTKALHIHTEGTANATIDVPFSATGNSFFGRAYVWVDAFPVDPDWAHFVLVDAKGTGNGSHVRPFGGQFIPPAYGGGSSVWGIGSDEGPTGDWTSWKTSDPTVDGKLMCLEWQMSAPDNSINLWIDGQEKTDLSVSTHVHGGNDVDFVFPQFNSISFGWLFAGDNPTPGHFDIWFDDIALAPFKIGCGS